MSRVIFDVPVSLVELTVDVVDSEGGVGIALLSSNALPYALRVAGGGVWFGFRINDRKVERVDPGQSVECLISFYNSEEAPSAFPPGASVLFGDCALTRGVIRVKRHNVDASELPGDVDFS